METTIKLLQSRPPQAPRPYRRAWLTNAQVTAILAWFSGKARANAVEALDALDKSMGQGFWAPGASRRVRAALTRANVAKKLVRDNAWLDNNDFQSPSHGARFNLYMAMTYGLVDTYGNDRFKPNSFDLIEADATTPSQRETLGVGRTYVAAMRPAFEAMRTLDATRPKPVFTRLGCSPTLTKTLTDMGLDLNLDTIRVCPMEWELVETVKNGRKESHYVARLIWPEGTLFGQSRFGHDGQHCEACGHSIRNACNWVPVLIDGKPETPYAFWVGRDCAKTLFGIDMVGDLEITKETGTIAS